MALIEPVPWLTRLPNRYRVVRRLASGGMSEVYLAVDLRRPEAPNVVIKRLTSASQRDAYVRELFARETRAYARLDSPHVVRLYDSVSIGPENVLVLEHVHGPALAEVMNTLRARQTPLPEPLALTIAAGVFSALSAAHTALEPETMQPSPVVHRDVSPSNVLLSWQGEIKLTDFGVAKLADDPAASRASLLKGTLGYMAPEQVVGAPVGPRTDIFAACVLLRELLLNRPTFPRRGLSEVEFMRSIAQANIEDLRKMRPETSPELAEMLRLGLERDPKDRMLTAQDAVRTLTRHVDPRGMRKALTSYLDELKRQAGLVTSSGVMRKRADAASAQAERASAPQPAMAAAPPPPPTTDPMFLEAPAPTERDPSNLPVLHADPPEQEMTPHHGAAELDSGLVRRATPESPAGWQPQIHVSASSNQMPVAAPGARVGLGAPTTTSLVPQQISLPPPPPRPALQKRTLGPLLIVAIFGGIAVGFGSSFWGIDAIGGANEAETHAVPTSAPPTTRRLIEPEVDGERPAEPERISPKGVLETPRRARGHRIFVDAKVVGQGGKPLIVECGAHDVQIGSQGEHRRVHVPCGGHVLAGE